MRLRTPRIAASRAQSARASRLEHAAGRLAPAVARAEVAEFEHGLRAITRYAGQHGDTDLRDGYADESGFPLAAWVASQREEHLEQRLQPTHRIALEQVPGWRWARGVHTADHTGGGPDRRRP